MHRSCAEGDSRETEKRPSPEGGHAPFQGSPDRKKPIGGNHTKSDADSWEERCRKEEIREQQKRGCKCGCSFPLKFCLVQLPDSFPLGFKFDDPKAIIKLRWWKPVDASAGFRGKWVVWFDEARMTSQCVSEEARGGIVLADIGVHSGSNNTKFPLRQRWVRLNMLSCRHAERLL